MLNHALQYEKLGYCVIPLRPKSKEPLIKWAEYQKRKATKEEIIKWWTTTPDANIGLVTGTLSCLAVVDLDGSEGLESGLRLGLASCVSVRTGNGLQHYYRDTEGLCRNSVKTLPGLDLRGEGGYVVAPPSIHPNGKRYSFLRCALGVEKLPLFSASIFARVVTIPDVPTATTTTSGVNKLSYPGKPDNWIATSLEDMKNGNIDDTLFKVCSRLRNDGYSPADAEILLRPHAERAGAVAGHLADKIKNVWNRYEPRIDRGEQATQAYIGQSNSIQLVIHNPTNPDSQQRFRESQNQLATKTEYPTGYTAFDALTGGLRKGEILTVAARTGVGKTNWLISPARTLCEAGKKVLLFSTEMSFDQIWSRYRATLKDDGDFANHKFYVCDDFAPNTERVEEALRLIMPDIFMFDHINNVGEEHLALAEFMKGLKFLARKFQIPCIMTAQLNRGADWVESGERIAPRLSMIKGSGTIEEVSAQVLLLAEKRVTPEGTEIFGVVDKNRFGQKGQVNLMLRQNPWRLTEV